MQINTILKGQFIQKWFLFLNVWVNYPFKKPLEFVVIKEGLVVFLPNSYSRM